MVRPGLVIAAFACAAVWALDGSSAATSARCHPPRTTTLVDNGLVRVFKRPNRYSPRGFEVDACSYRTGDGIPLDIPQSGNFAFLGPAIAARGNVVGWAQEACDPNDDICESGVHASDIARDHDLTAGFAGPKGRRLVKVGSLRVKASGSLAWIACPERRPNRARGYRRPNCVGSGDYDYVLMQVPGNQTQVVLDRGRRIDPRSLRLANGRLSWIHGSRRHHANLP